MPEFTSTLGLKKINPATDGNETFDVVSHLGDNWDKLDAEAARVRGKIDAANSIPLTLVPGTQIVNVAQQSLVSGYSIKGRTLVNLLGRDGNCEDVNKILTGGSGVTLSLDTTNNVYGSSGIKLTSPGGGSYGAYFNATRFLDPLAYYIALADVKNGNGQRIYVRADFAAGSTRVKNGLFISDGNRFSASYVKFGPTDLVGSTLLYLYIILTSTASGQTGFFDGVRLYKISKDEYDALDFMTPEEIALMFPYVESLQNVKNPYVLSLGKNLLPPFTSWTHGNTSNVIIEDTYKLKTLAGAGNGSRGVVVDVVANQSYSFSYNGDMLSTIYEYLDNNTSGVGLKGSANPVPWTFVPSSKRIIIYFTNNGDGNNYHAENPILNVGTTALSFEPQRNSYKFFNTELSDGDSLTLDKDGNASKFSMCRKVQIDGKYDAVLAGNSSGFKSIAIDIAKDGVVQVGTIVKFDGKVMYTQPLSQSLLAADQFWIGNASSAFTGNEVVLSISNSDSGWGDTYSPSIDEVRAFFNGWKMYNVEANSYYSTYNGTGTKGWCRRNANDPSTLIPNTGVISLPTTSYADFTPYQLQYQLANPVFESVQTEGDVWLFEGANQLSTGTGVVIREANIPTANDPANTAYYINRVDIDSTKTGSLRYRNAAFFEIYKNGDVTTNSWSISNHASAYGLYRASHPYETFDKTAAYSVTYFVLDAYKFSVASQAITATYEGNIAEVVNDLVRQTAQVATRVSVVENQYARKQQGGWINATLLNGWGNQGSTLQVASFRKTELGEVQCRGEIFGGTLTGGTVIFYLPVGYRPSKILQRVVANAVSDGSATYAAILEINTDGRVVVWKVFTNNRLSLSGLDFHTD
jgi:hypothetical protein